MQAPGGLHAQPETTSKMPYRTWVRIVWIYHLVFAAAVTWPGQTLVNTPAPFVLGLPRQMAWVAAWLVGSLFVLWRMDAARGRRGAGPASEDERDRRPAPEASSSGTSRPGATHG